MRGGSLLGTDKSVVAWLESQGAPHDLIRIAAVEQWDLPTALKRLRDAIEEDKCQNGIAYYTPQEPHQTEYHRMEAHAGGIVGANQSGKTTAAVADVIWRCQNKHPYKKYDHPPRFLFGIPSYDTFETVHDLKFDELLPKKEIKSWGGTVKSRTENPMVWANGAQVHFRSYEVPRKRWQGGTYDGVYLDEEPPKEIYDEIEMRTMRRAGFLRFSLTPVEGTTWLYSIVTNPQRFHLIHAKTADNVYIPREELERQRERYRLPDGSLSEEGMIRLEGAVILRSGKAVFDSSALQRILTWIDENPNLGRVVDCASLPIKSKEKATGVAA